MKPKTDVDISLVVPCFNEEATLSLFYRETAGVMNGEKTFTSEFIFVDDGSGDATADVLKELALNNDNVHYIILSRNFGKEAAMLAGLQKAGGRYAVTLDADLQDPPALIPAMLQAVSSGEFDCAGTRRVTRRGEPAIRSFFARCFYRIMAKFTDMEVVDGARDFRLMSRRYLDAVLSLNERNRFSKGIFPWIGFKTKWFEYENIPRAAGETKWSFGKLFIYSLDGIFAFSSRPLAVASVLGVLFFLSSLLFISIIIFRKILLGDPVDGWASTACIILFCSGIQLFTVGVLGQYLAKTYTEVKQRPHYIVKEEK
ncbi:MAG: glycosyltransferase family 2 protein [Dysgonamonadaceae bacterium]|jgi:glycosyltransferase involved in cell wall biosynthesis|nr:glycosyltransferase family 2 protein [Dysgonamonadaceae bacterium]